MHRALMCFKCQNREELHYLIATGRKALLWHSILHPGAMNLLLCSAKRWSIGKACVGRDGWSIINLLTDTCSRVQICKLSCWSCHLDVVEPDHVSMLYFCCKLLHFSMEVDGVCLTTGARLKWPFEDLKHIIKCKASARLVIVRRLLATKYMEAAPHKP